MIFVFCPSLACEELLRHLQIYYISCIRHTQSSLDISALSLCRQYCDPRSAIRRWCFFSLTPFYNLHRLVKHLNILINTNVNYHLNETNIAISLRVSITKHLKLVRIYLPNPVIISSVFINDLNRANVYLSTL